MQVTQIVRHDTLPDIPTQIGEDAGHNAIYYTKDEVNDIVEGNTFDFFLNNTLAGIGSPEYFTMDPTETGEGASTFSDTITNDAFLIDSWATSTSEPTFSALVSGIYAFHIHAETTTGANVGTVRLYWELYRRLADSPFTETLLITSEQSNILVGAELEYDIHGTLATDFMLDVTDRLVLKVYANIEVSRPTDPVVTLTAEGSTAAHFEVVTTITAFDDRYVQVAGDTMTGPLNMSSDINIADTHHLVIGNDSLIPIVSGSPEFQMLGTGFTDSAVALLRASDNVNAPNIILTKSRGDLTSPTVITSGDNLGNIRAVGHDDNDLNTISSEIVFCTEGTIAQNQIPGIISLRTANSSGTLTDALVLDSSQKATFSGVGTIAKSGSNDLRMEAAGGRLIFAADNTIEFENNLDISGHNIRNVDNLTMSGTFTDGTMSLSGGNITSMGNITGTDVDITAGTGDYTGQNMALTLGGGAVTTPDFCIDGDTNPLTVSANTINRTEILNTFDGAWPSGSPVLASLKINQIITATHNGAGNRNPTVRAAFVDSAWTGDFIKTGGFVGEASATNIGLSCLARISQTTIKNDRDGDFGSGDVTFTNRGGDFAYLMFSSTIDESDLPLIINNVGGAFGVIDDVLSSFVTVVGTPIINYTGGVFDGRGAASYGGEGGPENTPVTTSTGGEFTAGNADDNVGIKVNDVSGGTTNIGIKINDVSGGDTHFAILTGTGDHSFGGASDNYGFYGATPVALQTIASDTLANLYIAIRALGLIA